MDAADPRSNIRRRALSQNASYSSSSTAAITAAEPQGEGAAFNCHCGQGHQGSAICSSPPPPPKPKSPIPDAAAREDRGAVAAPTVRPTRRASRGNRAALAATCPLRAPCRAALACLAALIALACASGAAAVAANPANVFLATAPGGPGAVLPRRADSDTDAGGGGGLGLAPTGPATAAVFRAIGAQPGDRLGHRAGSKASPRVIDDHASGNGGVADNLQRRRLDEVASGRPPPPPAPTPPSPAKAANPPLQSPSTAPPASPSAPPQSPIVLAACGAAPLAELPPPLRSQQALQSCPLVAAFLVRKPKDAARQQAPQQGAGSTTGAGGDGGGGGTDVPAGDPDSPPPLCAAAVLTNNGKASLYGWQLVWRFSNYTAYRTAEVDGAVLVTSGEGAPVRVVNTGETTSLPPSGGTTNFSMSLALSNATPRAAAPPLEWASVFVNGQRCVQLPSSSLGLQACGLPYEHLVAGGKPPAPLPGFGAGPPGSKPDITCASVFCCGDLDPTDDPADPGTIFGRPKPSAPPGGGAGAPPAGATPPQPPDSIAQLSSALSQLTALVMDLLPATGGAGKGPGGGWSAVLAPPPGQQASPGNSTTNTTGGGVGSAGGGGPVLSPEVVSRLHELLTAAANGVDVTVELLATLQEIVREGGFGGVNGTAGTGSGSGGSDVANLTLVLDKIAEIVKMRAQPPAPPAAPASPPPPAPAPANGDMQQSYDPSLQAPTTGGGEAPKGPQGILPPIKVVVPAGPGKPGDGKGDASPPPTPTPLDHDSERGGALPDPDAVTRQSKSGFDADEAAAKQARRRQTAVAASATVGALLLVVLPAVAIAVLVVRRRRQQRQGAANGGGPDAANDGGAPGKLCKVFSVWGAGDQAQGKPHDDAPLGGASSKTRVAAQGVVSSKETFPADHFPVLDFGGPSGSAADQPAAAATVVLGATRGGGEVEVYHDSGTTRSDDLPDAPAPGRGYPPRPPPSPRPPPPPFLNLAAVSPLPEPNAAENGGGGGGDGAVGGIRTVQVLLASSASLPAQGRSPRGLAAPGGAAGGESYVLHGAAGSWPPRWHAPVHPPVWDPVDASGGGAAAAAAAPRHAGGGRGAVRLAPAGGGRPGGSVRGLTLGALMASQALPQHPPSDDAAAAAADHEAVADARVTNIVAPIQGNIQYEPPVGPALATLCRGSSDSAAAAALYLRRPAASPVPEATARNAATAAAAERSSRHRASAGLVVGGARNPVELSQRTCEHALLPARSSPARLMGRMAEVAAGIRWDQVAAASSGSGRAGRPGPRLPHGAAASAAADADADAAERGVAGFRFGGAGAVAGADGLKAVGTAADGGWQRQSPPTPAPALEPRTATMRGGDGSKVGSGSSIHVDMPVAPAAAAAATMAAAGGTTGAVDGGRGGGTAESTVAGEGSLPSACGTASAGFGMTVASSATGSLGSGLRDKQTSWVAIDFARDVVLERRLGSGAYGTVYRGRWAGRPVACKVVPLLEGDSGAVCPKAVESIRQEVQVLSRLSHPHIVQFYGACLAPPYVCIIEELAAGGSLHHRLHAKRRGTNVKLRPPLTYVEVLRLGLEVASAMAYLHPHVVHRDLKPQNVLLDAAGRARVCDFGIAKIKDRTLLSTRNTHAGTPAYMAPEQFEGRPVSEKVDVYAFGMTLYECLTGEQPWSELQNPMQVIFVVGVQCQRPPLPPSTPAALSALITACWADCPEERPPFSQIVPWLQNELAAAAPAATGTQRPMGQ